MNSKQMFALLSVLVMAGLLLAACGGGAAPAEPEKLSVWITWGDNPAQLQELFNGFGEENGITIEVTAPVEEDKILTALSSSTPPDILILSGGDLVKSYAAEGLVEPLNDLIASGGVDLNDIFEAPLQQCKQGDEIWCLPWGTDIYALFWNKDLFKAAGLDPEKPPATLEELVEMSDLLTQYDADGNITQLGFVPDFSWSHIDLYVRQFGGFWYNEEGTEVTLNSQPVIDALKWEQQFYTKPGVDKMLAFASTFGDYNSSEQAFYAGKLAFQVDGEWQVGPNFIQAFAPNLNYGVAAFPPPAAHPERANTAVVQGTVAVIPANAQNKEWSAKLLAWMESPEIIAEEMYTNSNLPTSKKAAEDPRFNDIPNFDVFIKLMSDPNATYIITTPISLEINDEMGSIEEQILREGADPKPLLDEAQEKFAPLLQEALGQ